MPPARELAREVTSGADTVFHLAAQVAVSLENLTNDYYLLAGSTGLAFSPSNPRSYSLRVFRTW